MTNKTQGRSGESVIASNNYSSPTLRIIDLCVESSFLQSNIEPIIDDGQEHDWD